MKTHLSSFSTQTKQFEEGKVFFMEELQLTNAEGMTEVENHHLSIPKPLSLVKKMELGDNHHCKLESLKKNRGRPFFNGPTYECTWLMKFNTVGLPNCLMYFD